MPSSKTPDRGEVVTCKCLDARRRDLSAALFWFELVLIHCLSLFEDKQDVHLVLLL